MRRLIPFACSYVQNGMTYAITLHAYTPEQITRLCPWIQVQGELLEEIDL